MKTNAAKRYRHPNHVALIGQLAAGVPHRIVGIVRAAVLGPECIGLNSPRIYVEEEAVTLVVKSIERQFDVVVVGRGNGFAPRQMSADGLRFFVPANPDD